MRRFPRPSSKNWTSWLVQPDAAPAPRGPVLFEKTLPSTPKAIAGCLDLLLAQLAAEALIDAGPEIAVQTRLVLDEALVNCVKHGNRGDRKKKVFVTLYRLPERRKRTGWGLIVRDQGRGFSVAEVPDVEQESSLFLEHGRGVLLMRQFLNAVQYFEGGRVLLMEKYRA